MQSKYMFQNKNNRTFRERERKQRLVRGSLAPFKKNN